MGAADPSSHGTSPHYHPIGIFFHWLMAALVFVQLWWGWSVHEMAAGLEKAEGYVFHARLGSAILVTSFLRLGWRLIAPFVAPRLEEPEDLPGWQRLAAEITHWLLYALMIALPVTGLLMIAATAPETLERALGLPGLRDVDFGTRATIEHVTEILHLAMVIAIMGLITLHVGAALKHHFIDRDEVLARMIPFLRRGDDPRKSLATRKANTAKATR